MSKSKEAHQTLPPPDQDRMGYGDYRGRSFVVSLFRVEGLGFRVEGLGFGLRVRVEGLGFRARRLSRAFLCGEPL
jgi:hypothetical protein